MKRFVKAEESLVDKFLRYHDDENNYHHNPSGYDAMYKILEKYDDSNGDDTVDVAFLKATPEDQQKMIDLISPGKWALRPGVSGYAKNLYQEALAGQAFDYRQANEAALDVFEALFAEGFLDEDDFSNN